MDGMRSSRPSLNDWKPINGKLDNSLAARREARAAGYQALAA